MSRLIDADNIKEAKFNNVPYVKTTPTDSELELYMRGWNDAIDAIAECEPTVDAVEIVRCKDCRHYGWTENRIPSEREWWCYEWNDAREETDFCSHAERWQDEIG